MYEVGTLVGGLLTFGTVRAVSNVLVSISQSSYYRLFDAVKIT